VSCGAKRSKKEMLRFVLGEDQRLLRDEAGHRSGRGGYACKGSFCIDRLMNRKNGETLFRAPRGQRKKPG